MHAEAFKCTADLVTPNPHIGSCPTSHTGFGFRLDCDSRKASSLGHDKSNGFSGTSCTPRTRDCWLLGYLMMYVRESRRLGRLYCTSTCRRRPRASGMNSHTTFLSHSRQVHSLRNRGSSSANSNTSPRSSASCASSAFISDTRSIIRLSMRLRPSVYDSPLKPLAVHGRQMHLSARQEHEHRTTASNTSSSSAQLNRSSHSKIVPWPLSR